MKILITGGHKMLTSEKRIEGMATIMENLNPPPVKMIKIAIVEPIPFAWDEVSVTL